MPLAAVSDIGRRPPAAVTDIGRSPSRIFRALADKKGRPLGRDRSPLRALARRGSKEPAPESDGGAEGERSAPQSAQSPCRSATPRESRRRRETKPRAKARAGAKGARGRKRTRSEHEATARATECSIAERKDDG